MPEPNASLRTSLLFEQEFIASSWFTRGWTLQELLAPQKVDFFNSDFEFIGNRSTLAHLIYDATGIRNHYFLHFRRYEVSVAERMRWASKRKTTRPEDLAYCLIGLFNVNMPLLYGEGPKAFVRLQLEIIKDTTDESISAWNRDGRFKFSPLLAPHPSFFAFPWYPKVELVRHTYEYRHPYAITNRGLELILDVTEGFDEALTKYAYCLLPLNCALLGIDSDDGQKRRAGLRFKGTSARKGVLDVPDVQSTISSQKQAAGQKPEFVLHYDLNLSTAEVADSKGTATLTLYFTAYDR